MTELILMGIVETLILTLVPTLISYVLGIPMGLLLVVTDKNGIRPMPKFNAILGAVVNIVRSVPFIILLVALIPFTRMVVGTGTGNSAMIVTLIIGAAPFVARLIESSIKEVDSGVIEAAQSMGASNWQIITKVMIPEAKPSLLVGSAVATITILGYTAMAGFVGAGGLGKLAIQYGHYRYDAATMWIIVAILVIIVQILQEFGMWVAKRTDHRIS